jgi:hypothetical protein
MPSDTAETMAFGPYSCHPSQHFSAKLRTVRIEDRIAARCSEYVCTCRRQTGQALRPKRIGVYMISIRTGVDDVAGMETEAVG